MYTFYLALYGYYFTQTELFGEWCAVTFNEVNVNVKADLFIIRCDCMLFTICLILSRLNKIPVCKGHEIELEAIC